MKKDLIIKIFNYKYKMDDEENEDMIHFMLIGAFLYGMYCHFEASLSQI